MRGKIDRGHFPTRQGTLSMHGKHGKLGKCPLIAVEESVPYRARMRDVKAKILSNEEITDGYFKMTIDAPSIAREAKPGQFVQVRCSDSFDPLLRRPFSIHRAKELELLYEVVGRGTEVLSKKRKGDTVDVLGPLGNGFTLPLTTHHSPLTILIAGGIGGAPLLFLADVLVQNKIKPIVLIGARTKKLILCKDDFKKLGCEVHIATDDGSRGYKGFVSELFKKILRTTHNPSALLRAGAQRITIYACGPEPMLKSVTRICRERKLQCQVCLEEMMACGIAVCLGCVKKTKSGNKLVCKDGPVFDANEIIW